MTFRNTGPGTGPNGASYTSGSLDSWSDSGGAIAMTGVKIIGGLETANYYISDAPHSNSFTIMAAGGVSILPLGLPITLRSGSPSPSRLP